MTNPSAFIKITPQQHQNCKWFCGKEKPNGIISVSSGSATVEGGKSSRGSLPFQSSNSTTATAFANLQAPSVRGPGPPRSAHRCPCPELRARVPGHSQLSKSKVCGRRDVPESQHEAEEHGAHCAVHLSPLPSAFPF